MHPGYDQDSAQDADRACRHSTRRKWTNRLGRADRKAIDDGPQAPTPEPKLTDMWRRWKAGDSLHEIGRAFGKGHGSIRFLLTQRGGIVPAARRRSPRTLTLAEREDISRGIASGSSIREIASGLQRAVSTVSREVSRHGGRPLYRASEADRRAWELALRPKVCLLAIDQKLRTIVARKLILDWSPEQISAWLKVRYPRNESMRVSHETIYRSLFIQARGVLKKELIQHLRSKHFIRHSRHSRAGGQSRGQIVDAISIRERPAEIEDRAIPGHWEGDLLSGSRNSHIATLVERHSRFYHAGQSAQQRYSDGRRRAEPARS
jgi:hypothetical protein